ncbi:cation:proton antiporter [Mycobacterium tuberculosis]|uniref:cation:proton antiporter n=1 Tax=Mycobacterium tuberculosis TaxID=1773 RepID=UPI00272A65DE|nr:cation:proton antiporter [Mycobacterium tuberculosis]
MLTVTRAGTRALGTRRGAGPVGPSWGEVRGGPLAGIRQPVKLLAVVAIIPLGKTVAAVALVLLFRYPLNTALTVGVSLAQIGEFSAARQAAGRGGHHPAGQDGGRRGPGAAVPLPAQHSSSPSAAW